MAWQTFCIYVLEQWGDGGGCDAVHLGSGVFSTTSLNNPVPDLFGSNSIDDGIEHGRHQ